MTAGERILRTSKAVASALGGNHLAYLSIVAVIIHAHESACETDRWELVRDEELWRAAREGADEIRASLATRARRAVVAA